MTRPSAPRPRARARAVRVVVALLVGCLLALIAAPAAGALSVTTVPTTTATGAADPAATTARPAVAPKTTLQEVEKELMCSTCRVPLAQSDAPQAQQERQTIERLIAEGLTKDQIIDEMVEIYSESVLIHPPEDGVRTLRWLVPAVAALIGFSLVAFLVVRWRRSTRAAQGAGPSDPTAGWVDAPKGSSASDDSPARPTTTAGDRADPGDGPSEELSAADRKRLDDDLDRYA
ncbi:MAG: cytochrome c-type biogenesis protein CcmH [Patulibacter sp.]|nr:cytochrome c-type biogenesis protein CcmH [Patulibacter sp.]